MKYTIYKTVNTITGRYYIGMHATLNPNDTYLGSGLILGCRILENPDIRKRRNDA
jgi:hypothetical protein